MAGITYMNINEFAVFSTLNGTISTTLPVTFTYDSNIYNGIDLFIPSTSGESGTFNISEYDPAFDVQYTYNDIKKYGVGSVEYDTSATFWFDITPDNGYMIDKVGAEDQSSIKYTYTELNGSSLPSTSTFRYSHTVYMNTVYSTVYLDVMFKPILVSSITLNETNLTELSAQNQLVASVLPANALNQSLIWSTSDINVATVDQTGLITPVTGGTCVISVKSTDGSDITSICTVNVSGDIVSPEIFTTSLLLDPPTKTSKVGSSFTLAPTFTPDTVTNKTLIWTTSDSGRATVANGLVNCVGYGEVIITATTSNGVQSTCSVMIYNYNVTLSDTSLTVTLADKTKTLSATVKDSSGNIVSVVLTWTSSDPAIATVDQTGIVTFLTEGAVDIIATMSPDQGSAFGICKLSIVKPIPLDAFELSDAAKEAALALGLSLGDFKVPIITFTGGIPFPIDIDALLTAFTDATIIKAGFTKEHASKMKAKFGLDLPYVFICVMKMLTAVGKAIGSIDPSELFNTVMSFAKDSMMILQLKAQVQFAKSLINSIKNHAAIISTPITAFPAISGIIAALGPLMKILEDLQLIQFVMQPLSLFIKPLVEAINTVNAALEPVYSAPVIGALFPKLTVSE